MLELNAACAREVEINSDSKSHNNPKKKVTLAEID